MKRFGWTLILAAQAASAFIWSYFAVQTMWVNAALYAVCSWALLPLLGGASAFFAVRKGLNNYLAWIMPPVCAVAAHYAAFYYLPASAGPAFVCAVASVLGAATGEALKKYGHGGGGATNGK